MGIQMTFNRDYFNPEIIIVESSRLKNVTVLKTIFGLFLNSEFKKRYFFI